jgi:endo-alpha-1,4-polygalactosaminidase (GH114 family)
MRAGIGLGVVIGASFGSAMLMHASIDETQDRGSGIAIRHEALAGLASWGMQLRQLDPAAPAVAGFDLLVVDELLGGAPTAELARTVSLLQARSDGSRRLVLARLAIGGEPTEQGDRRARFWDEAWQARIVGAPSAAMERILTAGFDGVYLDHGDVHERWGRDRPAARDEMIAFVERIARHAREWRPGFIMALQNPGSLVESSRFRATIDAVAKADLVYGLGAPHEPSSQSRLATEVARLKRALRDGLAVLVVEHLNDPAKATEARRILDDHGFLSYIGPRELDRLVPQE